ncbi:hypothetical protein GDO86_002586 [Hymenochirus boettgeri]|uniref:Uncharacterized protein n=1 Tax=Hymenochirus boettgeri TaxID=247094 RepID=A0A8T2KLF5_9PIPI|nr:hypothetical protein GDO86_002586 [Hymenochirus boettgeri]
MIGGSRDPPRSIAFNIIRLHSLARPTLILKEQIWDMFPFYGSLAQATLLYTSALRDTFYFIYFFGFAHLRFAAAKIFICNNSFAE